MNRQTDRPVDLPTTQQLANERRRLRYKSRYNRTLRSTVAILLVVAALAVLIAMLWMPVLRIYGSSLAPTLQDGQIVVCVKSRNFEPGDIAAFYHGSKLLIKRYIAGPGQWVELDGDVGTATLTYHDSSADKVKVENQTGTELPSTGGVGTTIFYIIGSLLAVGAVILLVTRKRMGKPEDVTALQIEPRKDLCTLVTCTPYGINSHRLLVRGHRVETVQAEEAVRLVSDGIQIEPLLVAPVVALPMLLALLLILLLSGNKPPHRDDEDSGPN